MNESDMNMSLQQQLLVLTPQQARQWIRDAVREEFATLDLPPRREEGDDFLTSLKDICDFFHVGKSKAQVYKNTFLKPAVRQRPGERNFSINKAEARRLFDEEFNPARFETDPLAVNRL